MEMQALILAPEEIIPSGNVGTAQGLQSVKLKNILTKA